jgi:hypothetical protein
MTKSRPIVVYRAGLRALSMARLMSLLTQSIKGELNAD